MTRSLTAIALLAIVAASAPLPVLAASAMTESSVATVNGKAISKNRADLLIAMQTAQGRPDSEELRNEARNELVSREILTQEAMNKGYGNKADVNAQIELARQNILINAYLQDYLLGHPINESALLKEYAVLKAQSGDKEYRSRHILVESEEEAKAIIEKLAQGMPFDELAKQSKDPGSATRGGDLGWATPKVFVKPFADALTGLETGRHTVSPVKTPFGYHVIMLDDTREPKVPAFDDLKPTLFKRLQAQKIEDRISELRAKAKVE